MDLDNIRVEIRPRSALEAIDLGFAMARQWFIPLWLIWIAVVSPLFLLTHLLSFKHFAIVSWFIWWLKPVYERPLVFWLSRALFDEKPGFKEIAKQYLSIIKPRLFVDLTYLRLSPNRSFYMPVTILEDLKGEDYKNRVKVLGNNQSAGVGLTFVSAIFEIILTLSILVVIFYILPEGLRWTSLYDFFSGNGNVESLINNFINIFSMSIIAPFYVAAGFSLYINRRAKLEAWDIEISFKRLMARRATKKKTTSKAISMTIGLFFLLTCCFIVFSDSAYAESTKIISKKEASLVIDKVLEHDDFGKKKIETAWKLKKIEKIDFNLPEWLQNFLESFGKSFEWMQNVPEIAGVILEVLAWITGGIIVVFVFYKIRQNKQWFKYYRKVPQKNFKAPSKLFGLDISEKSLPDDIIHNVRELLKNNEIRNALSLLYRGTLVKLVNDFNIQIPTSATENECIALVKLKSGKRERIFFQTLTQMWLVMAYGHIIPERQTIEEVLQTWHMIYDK